MELNLGMRLCGFTVTRLQPVAELKATLYELKHDKTGAGVCWLNNGDTNKLFSVAFKTIPEDDTGVFHILEHSVLAGSEKYPVREPFVELLKSSMQTFLNAMTFPDKTVYPVSSRNEQDFLNLVDVYLDAVFAPSVGKNPNIFYQEGWHIELDGEKAIYKGVVFNEMKGAMSNVNDVIEQGNMSLLFPDSCYGYNSGGDPEAIPDLTYEAYMDSYHRHYHPSNARFYFDGAVPIGRLLEKVDGYLSRYTEDAKLPVVVMQQPKSAERTQYYEIAPGEDSAGKCHLTLSKIMGTWADKRKILAAKILCAAMEDSNDTPLKKAILSTGLGQDLDLYVQDGIAQPYFTLTVRNMEDSKAEEIIALIRKTVNELCEGGLDHAMLEAFINRYEFRTRQLEEPQGLVRCIESLSSWLYDGDPLLYLINDADFAALRAMLTEGGFEQLLRELLLEEDGLCILHTLPSTTLGDEKRAREAARLAEIQAGWSEADKLAIIAMNEKLAAWQSTPDTPEQLATMPMLTLDEVNPEPVVTGTVEQAVDGVTTLYHSAPCHGIVHLNYYFTLTDCTLDELRQLSLLSSLLGKLPTGEHTALALQQEIKCWLGSLSFGLSVHGKPGMTDRCTPCLVVRCSVLEDNLNRAKSLIREVLTQTRFDSLDNIRDIVAQVHEECKQSAVMAGHALAAMCVAAHYSAHGAVDEATSGFSNMQWLKEFNRDFDTRAEAFIKLLTDTLGRVVCKARMTLSVTAAEPVETAALVADYPQGAAAPADAAYASDLPARMGIRIPAQIGFAVQGYHLSLCGKEWDGSALVASQILFLDYLWNQVRVQGGAYGSGMSIGRGGRMRAHSFRDPSPDRTLNIYADLAKALREKCESGESLDKYIISTTAETEPLRSPREEGAKADSDWFTNTTLEDQRRIRREILSADRAKLLAWCDALEQMAANGAVCVVGHDGALVDCGNLEIFDL